MHDSNLDSLMYTKAVKSFFTLLQIIIIGYTNGLNKFRAHKQTGGNNLSEIDDYTTPKVDLSSEYKNNIAMITEKLFSGVSKTIFKFINTGIDYAFGDINTEQDMTPNIKRNILFLASILNELANDPEQIKAIQSIAEDVTRLGFEIIEIAEPSINMMVDRTALIAERIADKYVDSGVKLALSYSEAVIAAIPGVGAGIDMLIAIGITLNTVTGFVAEMTSYIAGYEKDILDIAGSIQKPLDKKLPKIEEKINKLKQQSINKHFDKSLNKKYINQNTLNQTGGYKKNKKNIANRINNSVNNFILL